MTGALLRAIRRENSSWPGKYGGPGTAQCESLWHVWDVATGARAVTLHGWGWSITHLAMLPDGRAVTAGGGVIGVWDFDRLHLHHAFQASRLGGSVLGLAVHAHPGGRRAFSGCSTGRVHLWSLAGGGGHQQVQAHPDRTTAIELHPDGRHLVSAGADGRVVIWDLAG